MKILCFGDSNTYGYDPRSYYGGRYTAGSRWVDILARKSGHETVNFGQNGRGIPAYSEELELLSGIFRRENAGLFTVMLGSNDILSGLSPKSAAARMERFLRSLPVEPGQVLLIAPPVFRPGAWVEGDKQIEASKLLAGLYRELAGKLGTAFADAESWGVDISHDGVHFTEKGHRSFAEGIYDTIKNIKEI